jgi:hypothetical protein
LNRFLVNRIPVASPKKVSESLFVASRKNLEELQEQVQIQQINTSAYPHNPEIAKIIPDVYI